MSAIVQRLLARLRRQPRPEPQQDVALDQFVVADSIEGIDRALADGLNVWARPELVKQYMTLLRYAGRRAH